MSLKTKFFCGLTLRCFGAALTGCAVVGTFVIGLAVLGGRDEMPHAHLARQKIVFPENEQMLKNLSSQLMREANTTAPETVKKLQDIQPAAGGDDTPLPPQP